jgi:branched-chain amino acid transport system permease protein
MEPRKLSHIRESRNSAESISPPDIPKAEAAANAKWMAQALRPSHHYHRTAWMLVGLGAMLALSRGWSDRTNAALIGGAIPVLVACGLHVLVHWTGQVSLAQAAFVGVGAFATAALNANHQIPLPLAMFGGVVAAAVAAALIGLPALRLRGLVLAITTFAFGFAADRWLFGQEWLAGGSVGLGLHDRSLLGFDLGTSTSIVVPVLVLTFAGIMMTLWLGDSRIADGLRMVAADEEVASAYGVISSSLSSMRGRLRA